ncbi:MULTISPECIES: hypothetical protein [Pedobacter]|uniref:hypothetical protein n=1 Tax=Pedobacter TaxID=84567 RepID=UPI001E502194|nr:MULTISPECIES: hypothetical protein [Pedobacter]
MAKFITWKSNWYNSNFELFIDGVQKGAITFATWKSDAETTLENENYFFTNVGFWKSKTNIINRKTDQVIGSITYDAWKFKAIINMESGEQYEWKSTSFWKSEWILSNNNNVNITYSAKSRVGSIMADTDNRLLIIAGLFIKQIYNRRAAAAA